MKHTLFPVLFAGALLADVAPGGCGKRSEPPLPPAAPATATATAAPVSDAALTPVSPATTDGIPAPPAF